MTGREIWLDAPAERVVALTASDCEILYALGAGDLLVSGAGRFHGHRVMLYRNLNRDRDGVPVFDSGESIGLAGRDFQPLRRPDGRFDLIASWDGTPFPGQLDF